MLKKLEKAVKNRANPNGDRLPLCRNFYCELLRLGEDRGGFEPLDYLNSKEIRDFSVYYKESIGYLYISLERLFNLTDEEKYFKQLDERDLLKSELAKYMIEDIRHRARRIRGEYSGLIGEEITPMILSTPFGMSALLVDYEGENPYLEWYTMYWNIRKIFEYELDLMNTGRYPTSHDSRIIALEKIYDVLKKLKVIAKFFAYERIRLVEPPKFPKEMRGK